MGVSDSKSAHAIATAGPCCIAQRGRVAAIACSSTVRIYSARSRAPLATLEVSESSAVTCLAMSEKDGSIFCGSDFSLNKWDLRTGAFIATLQSFAHLVTCLAISETEGALFSGYGDNTIKKWDVKTGTLTAALESHEDGIKCLAISEKEGAIFSGSKDTMIKKWDLKTGALMVTLKGHAAPITCLAISEKEGAIFSGSGPGILGGGHEDTTIKKWDLKTGILMATLEGHVESIHCLAISETEGAIFSAENEKLRFRKNNETKNIRKWNLKTGALLATLEGHADWIDCLVISEKEGAMFSASVDTTIKKWNLKTGALMATWEGHTSSFECLAILENEGFVFSSCRMAVKKWDMQRGALVDTLEGRVEPICCLAISEKEGAIFSGSDFIIKKWDLKNGALITTLDGHASYVKCLAISEKEGAIFSGSFDKTIRKWDLKTGALMALLRGHRTYVLSSAISEKEGSIFSGSDDKTIKKWDLKSGALMATLEGHTGPVDSLVISEKEAAIFSGSQDRTVKKWDLGTGALLATLEGDTGVLSFLAISDQEGAIFSTAASSKTINRWDLKTGTLMATLEGRIGTECLAISDKEGAIFIGVSCGKTFVHDLKSGRGIAEVGSHARTRAICCSETGRVFSGSTALCAFDARTLIRHRVIISTRLPEPYFSLERRVMPWALLLIATVTKALTLCQLASYAFRRSTAIPKRWVPPTKALDRFADLGVSIDYDFEFEQIYISVLVFVLVFLSLLFFAGAIRDEVWSDPSNNIKKCTFLCLGIAFKLIIGACFLPCMKILLWPLAAWEEDGLTILAGAITAFSLFCAKMRLVLIDTDLNRLRATSNIFDWSNDLRAPETGNEEWKRQEAFARTEQHALSARSQRYDAILAFLGLLSLLNSLFCTRLADGGMTTAVIQLILGILVFCAGYFYDPYFAPYPEVWDQNRLQNGLDAGLVAIYIAALIATAAAKYYSEEVLNSIWIVCSPLLTLPFAYVGYNFRRLNVGNLMAPSNYEQLNEEDS